MANTLTFGRILLSVGLLFCPAFSDAFYALYLAAGLTDMLDGPIARKTGTASAFGAQLDSAADLLFTAVCLGKLLPALVVPCWLMVWVAVIALIRGVNLISGWTRNRKLTVLHTPLNRVTGAALFLLPLTLRAVPLRVSAVPVCALATFAAVQEGHWIRCGREGG